MRRLVGLMASTSLLMLAACGGGGGGGVESLGSVTPPKVDVGTLTPTPVATPTPTAAHFLDITAETKFDAIGGSHSFFTNAEGNTTYAGNATAVSQPTGSVTYNPRDGIFTLTIADQRSSVTVDDRFQDPAHRTDFNPLVRPLSETPAFDTFNYLQAGHVSATDSRTISLFYQRPGAVTKYVTLAGFIDRAASGTENSVERGAFAFGQRTPQLQVPATGAGSFSGQFLATMVRSPSFDTNNFDNYAQWISGNSSITVDFAARSVAFGLNGTVGQTFVNDILVPDSNVTIKTGSTFSASGTAALTTTRDSFAGKFTSAGFTVNGTAIPVNFQSVNPANSTAGASSIDGTFYGPNAAEVGGSFRIVGGVPDMRVDILGGFTGKR